MQSLTCRGGDKKKILFMHIALTVEPLYNGHLWGTKFWPLYRGGLCRGVVLCTNSSFGTRVSGRYIAIGLSSGVAFKRGSTVSHSQPNHERLSFHDHTITPIIITATDHNNGFEERGILEQRDKYKAEPFLHTFKNG